MAPTATSTRQARKGSATPTAKAPGRTVIYCRISKDDENDGLAVARQETACREVAKRLGLEVYEVIKDEGISAYNTQRKRPGFERLMSQIAAGEVTHVVAYHLDRLARRMADFERIVEAVETSGCLISTAASGDLDLNTASGRFVARILGATAVAESERFAERMRARNDQKVAAGLPHGGGVPPYGYRYVIVDGLPTFEVDPGEWSVLNEIIEEITAGRSLYAIAARLNGEGVPTRERANAAATWKPGIVKSYACNPHIAGLRSHRGEIGSAGNWPALISRQRHEELVALLCSRRPSTRPNRRYLLSGLIRNTVNEPLKGRKVVAPSGRSRLQYTTGNPVALSCSIDADDLDAVIVEALLRRLETATVPKRKRPSGKPPLEVVAALEQEIDIIAADFASGAISRREWMQIRGPLNERLKAAQLAVGASFTPPALSALMSGSGSVRARWAALEASGDLVTRQAILNEAIGSIVVTSGKRGGPKLPAVARIDPDAPGFWRF